MSEDADRLRHAVARLARLLRQQDDGDLGPTATAALSTVRARGPITLGELAMSEHVSPPTMTKVIEKLEGRGFVSRDVDAQDRRITRVSSTYEGNRHLEVTRAARTAWLAERLGELDPAIRSGLGDAIAVLEAIVDERDAAHRQAS